MMPRFTPSLRARAAIREAYALGKPSDAMAVAFARSALANDPDAAAIVQAVFNADFKPMGAN